MMIFNSQVGNIEVLMLKGEKADPPVITETPIDNGYRVTIDDVSFDLTNATSGNYSQLTNKPSINSVLLSGNKTQTELGLLGLDDLAIIEDTVVVAGSSYVTETIDLSDYGISDATKWAVISEWCGFNGSNTYPRFVGAYNINPDYTSYGTAVNPIVRFDLYNNTLEIMIYNSFGSTATMYYRIVMLKVDHD